MADDVQDGLKSVTVWDVAKRAGVSQTTVSRSLSGSSRVSQAKALEIQRIAKEMDYQPKLAARLLRAKRSGQLVMIVDGDIATALEHTSVGAPLSYFMRACELQQRGSHIEFYKSPPDGEGAKLPEKLLSGLADGAVVWGYVNQELRQKLQNQKQWPWISMLEAGPYEVQVDAEEGVYQAAQHLAALGHRQVGYVDLQAPYATFDMGCKGFEKACMMFGFETGNGAWRQSFPCVGVGREEQIIACLNWARSCFKQADRPTAILCHGTILARSVIHAAMENGLNVPGDLSVISYGTAPDSENVYPFLTCLEVDQQAMFNQAVEMLCRLIDRKPVSDPRRIVVPQLVLRQTTAKFG